MGKAKSKESLRNLAQYKNLSDEEFEKVWEERQSNPSLSIENREEMEVRIAKMMEDFEDDYVLDDLKFNDRQVLRALIRAMLTLQDYEEILYETQIQGISSKNIRIIDSLNKLISSLRKDISDLQSDLKITRKNRKEEKEDSVENYIKDLQKKADKFFNKKVVRVVCPECGMMLFDGWFLYPEEDNKLIFNCGRMVEDKEDDNAKKCTGKVEMTSKELVELQTDKEFREKFPEGL